VGVGYSFKTSQVQTRDDDISQVKEKVFVRQERLSVCGIAVVRSVVEPLANGTFQKLFDAFVGGCGYDGNWQKEIRVGTDQLNGSTR
jgi:hypothetical protein